MGLDIYLHKVINPYDTNIYGTVDKILKSNKPIFIDAGWDTDETTRSNFIIYNELENDLMLFPTYLAPKWFQDLNKDKILKSLPTLCSDFSFYKTKNNEESAGLSYIFHKYGFEDIRFDCDWGRFPLPLKYIGIDFERTTGHLNIVETSIETFFHYTYDFLLHTLINKKKRELQYQDPDYDLKLNSYIKEVELDLKTYLKRNRYWVTVFEALVNLDYYVVKKEIAYQRKGVKSSYWKQVESNRGDYYFFCDTIGKLKYIAKNCMYDPKSFKSNFVRKFDPKTMFIENNY